MRKIDSRRVFGAEIQYFRIEPRYWDTMLRRFKETGLNCVTTYVPWSTHCVGEPDAKNPAGHFDFEGRTDPRLNLRRYLELVEKHGLELNFRAGPFCCTEMIHGGHPAWIVMGDPNMMVWDYQNRTTQGYWIAKREGSQPSYLHPRYLDLVGHWFRAVDAVALPHIKSKGGCITMINLDNEVSYIVKDSLLDSDYNPVNVSPGGYYHQFLTEKHGSLNNIPYAPKGASSIEAIEPPRSVPASVSGDLAWYTDWLEFKTWCMCRYITSLRQMHEDNGLDGITYMTNLNPHLPEGVPTRMPDFEKAVGEGGIVGYDFYRGSFMSYSGYQSLARVLKLMNASMRYTWSAEFMSGIWNRVLPSRVSDDHMRFMARCALAHGCKSLAWFMFHDRDCWGDSPLSSHAHKRPSIDVLTEVPDICFNKIKNWDALVPLTDAAVIYDLVQHQHTAIGDPSPCNDNDNHTGAPLIDGIPAGLASLEYYGLFRLIEQNGMQAGAVDIVHKPAELDAYTLAFLPGTPVIERRTEKALRRYITAGGTLVVSGPLPGRDEKGRKLTFLGIENPGRKQRVIVPIGEGSLIWYPDYLVQESPGEESLESIATVATLLKQNAGEAHVRISPAQETTWGDWKDGGGSHEYNEPRNLASAVLQENRDNKVLFVLNHYPAAFRFKLRFGQDHRPTALVDLDSGERIPVRNRQAEVDIDRKSGNIYLLA